MDSHDANRPPSYESCVVATADALQEPVLLVFAGQSIRAGSGAGLPLYETNRGLANLGHATTCVELTRVERSVRSTEAMPTEEDAKEFGEDEEVLVTPRVRVRRRHIMDLVHPTGKGGTATGLAETAVGTPRYYAKPWTKQTRQGTWGLKKAHGRARWQVLRVLEKGRYGEPTFDDKERPLFRVGREKGRYEWRGEEGERLALEEEEGEGKGKEFRLRTVKAMRRDEMDALVAMWCCRIWEAAAAAQPPIHEGMEKVRRRLRLAKEFPGKGGNLGLGVGGAAF